jgi:hypothetical protein
MADVAAIEDPSFFTVIVLLIHTISIKVPFGNQSAGMIF